METRRLKIEKLIRSEVNFYFMYSESGVMYFRNETQITEAEYMMADRSATRKEMPLFYDAEGCKEFNTLRTFEEPENNTKKTRK